MPTTLQQELALEMPNIRRAIIDTAVRASPIARRIPFESTSAISLTAPYISSLGTTGMRHLNEASSETSATFAQITHALGILENYIDIDPVVLQQKNTIQNFQVAQSRARVQGMMYKMVDLYINGDPLVDSREPIGIRAQLNREPRFNGQTVNASANGTELGLVVGTATDATYLQFLFLLNKLMAYVNMGSNSPNDETGRAMFITNWNALLTIEAAMRQLKLFNTAADQYDRTIMEYKGIPFLDAGWDESGAISGNFPAGGAEGDLVIGNDSEAVATTNGGNAYDKQTPIYLIRLGTDYQMGLQLSPMTVQNLGQTQTSPFYNRTFVRWVIQPGALWQKRAAARLVGLNFSGVSS